MIDLLIWLVALTVAVYLATRWAARRYGPDVRLRFLVANCDYTAAGLRKWICQYPAVAKRQIVPVSIPIDLLIAAALSVFFAICSMRFARQVSWPTAWMWLLAGFPLLYFFTHLVETVLFVRGLTQDALITDEAVDVIKSFIKLKVAALVLSVFELLILTALVIV